MAVNQVISQGQMNKFLPTGALNKAAPPTESFHKIFSKIAPKAIKVKEPTAQTSPKKADSAESKVGKDQAEDQEKDSAENNSDDGKPQQPVRVGKQSHGRAIAKKPAGNQSDEQDGEENSVEDAATESPVAVRQVIAQPVPDDAEMQTADAAAPAQTQTPQDVAPVIPVNVPVVPVAQQTVTAKREDRPASPKSAENPAVSAVQKLAAQAAQPAQDAQAAKPSVAENAAQPVATADDAEPVHAAKTQAPVHAAVSDDSAPQPQAANERPAPARPVLPQQTPEAVQSLVEMIQAQIDPPKDEPAPKSDQPTAEIAAAAQAPAVKPGEAHDAAPAQVAPVKLPEAQFVDANHPKIISSVRGELMPHGGTMHIRLDPPELGAVNVMVKIKEGVISVSFETSNGEATRLLSHSLSDLKTGLEAAGVNVDKLHVQQSSNQSSTSSDSDARGNPNSQDASSRQQEQQRREMMRRLWRKVSGGDPVDLMA